MTVLAVECGAKAIVTEKPMTNTLEEADRMVHACAEAGVPLCGGAAMADHPSFARAKQLVLDGAIGELLSIEAPAPSCQTQAWSYFVDDELAWAAGTGDAPRSETRRVGGRVVEGGVPRRRSHHARQRLPYNAPPHRIRRLPDRLLRRIVVARCSQPRRSSTIRAATIPAAHRARL